MIIRLYFKKITRTDKLIIFEKRLTNMDRLKLFQLDGNLMKLLVNGSNYFLKI